MIQGRRLGCMAQGREAPERVSQRSVVHLQHEIEDAFISQLPQAHHLSDRGSHNA